MYKNRYSLEASSPEKEEKQNATTVPVELPPPVTFYSQENTSEHAMWWNGVKEISIYLNDENAAIVNSHFTTTHPVVYALFSLLIIVLVARLFWH